jgi:hypothetical protein
MTWQQEFQNAGIQLKQVVGYGQISPGVLI